MKTMTHEQCREDVGAVIDGAASAQMREAVQAHLAGCSECRGYENQLHALSRMMAPEAALSTAFDSDFLAKLKAERPSRVRAFLYAKWWAPVLAGSFAAVLLVVGVGRRGLNEEQLFIAENQEMLSQLDLVKALDATADLDDTDFALVQALPALEKAN